MLQVQAGATAEMVRSAFSFLLFQTVDATADISSIKHWASWLDLATVCAKASVISDPNVLQGRKLSLITV